MGLEAATLLGVAHHLPDNVIDSDALAGRFVDTDGKSVLSGRALTRLTGVAERRYAAPGRCSSDLAIDAARSAMNRAGVRPVDIDLVIFAAATHDQAEPATVNRVQSELGCINARAMDVKNACNSFLDALDVAATFVRCGRSEVALVASGEVLSPFVALEATATRSIDRLIAGLTLGDAGAAMVIGRRSEGAIATIGEGSFLTIGCLWQASQLQAGGTIARLDYSEPYFVSDSAVIFDVAVREVPKQIEVVLHRMGWTPESVDLVVPHQASDRVVRAICGSVGIPYDRCMMICDSVGNTAAASVPLALSMASDAGRLQGASRALLVGGAAGFSAAAIPLTLDR